MTDRQPPGRAGVLALLLITAVALTTVVVTDRSAEPTDCYRKSAHPECAPRR